MKKNLSMAIAILFVSIIFASCSKTDLGTNELVNSNKNNPKSESITANANPVIANMGYLTVGKGTKAVLYNSIAVMDASGTNQTNLYYSAGLYFNPAFRQLTWSPTGTAVCFLEDTRRVRRLTVNVINGVPSASNITDLVTYTTTDSVWIRNISWSPSTTTSEIAYTKTAYTPSDVSLRRTSIMIVPSTGGTPVELYYELGVAFNGVTWSPDGSKLAVLISTPGSPSTKYIKTISRSTGQVLSTYTLGTDNFQYPSWSRTGLNKLCFNRTVGRYENYLYTLDLNNANSVPTLVPLPVGSVPTHPDWTSDNSKIIYCDNAQTTYGIKTVTLSSGTVTTINVNGYGYPDWKR